MLIFLGFFLSHSLRLNKVSNTFRKNLSPIGSTMLEKREWFCRLWEDLDRTEKLCYFYIENNFSLECVRIHQQTKRKQSTDEERICLFWVKNASDEKWLIHINVDVSYESFESMFSFFYYEERAKEKQNYVNKDCC